MTEIQNIFKMSEIFVQERMDTAADKLKNISRKADKYITNFIINNSDENGLISTDITGLDEDLDVNEIIHGKSATLPIFSDFAGTIIDALDSETKDGAIGATKQGATGDCWLLSGVNALSYTEKGREIIKDALEYTDDGVIVHLKGVGDYEVSNHEIAQTKASYQYSDGDDDMIVFELAIEKVLNDIAKADITINSSHTGNISLYPDLLNNTRLNASSTEGGNSYNALYLITGKTGILCENKNDMAFLLNAFQANNNKDFVLTAGINIPPEEYIYDEEGDMARVFEPETAVDIYGNTIKLAKAHVYAIKKVDNDNVTFVNPWDSSKEYTVSKEVFLDKFSDIECCDLSDNNPEQNFINHPAVITDNGEKIFLESSKLDNALYIEMTAYSKDGEMLDARAHTDDQAQNAGIDLNDLINNSISQYIETGSFWEDRGRVIKSR